jgi:hypothetical protein
MMSHLVQWYAVAPTASPLDLQKIFVMDSLKGEEVGKSDQVFASVINV